jgi:RNA polymerase sigma factor for flagellar operon FliA
MYVAEATDSAALVASHMELVRRIAFHLKGRLPASVQLEDLIQAGVIGLLEAIQGYQGGRGMLDEVRRLDGGPRSVHRDTRRISEAIRAVEARTGQAAASREIAAELGVTVEEYQRMVQRVAESRVLSLEDVLGDSSDDVRLAGSDGDAPDRRWGREELANGLAAAIRELPQREQLVLALYYDEELNQKEVGAVLGVTESRVCQLHGQALARLRSRLADWIPD